MVCVFQIQEGSLDEVKLSPASETVPKGGLWQVVLSESALEDSSKTMLQISVLWM